MKKFIAIIAVLIALFGASYYFGNQALAERFLPNTYINDVNVSFMTVEEADAVCKQHEYNLPVTLTIDGETFEVTEDDMDWSSFCSAQKFMNDSRFENLFSNLINGLHFQKNDSEAVIDSSADKIIATWNAFRNSNRTPSENAYVEYNESDGWVIVPEVQGNEINLDTAKQAIKDALTYNLNDYDLSTVENLYIKPEITSNTPELRLFRDNLNRATNKNIFYKLGNQTFELNQEYLVNYTTYDNETMTYTVNYEQAAQDFIAYLASEVDNIDSTREFKTSLGDTVSVPAGNWGWELNQEDTTAKLLELLKDSSVTAANGEFVWKQEAIENGDLDYKNYVEIDLTNQTLYMYKNGVLVISSPIVSGDLATGNSTPGGMFRLSYKTVNARLRGPTWDCVVAYWMPFNGGIGMHDATWKSQFGGNIYKTNGSHGCINLPLSAARTIYENIDSSFVIVCYWR